MLSSFLNDYVLLTNLKTLVYCETDYEEFVRMLS